MTPGPIGGECVECIKNCPTSISRNGGLGGGQWQLKQQPLRSEEKLMDRSQTTKTTEKHHSNDNDFKEIWNCEEK